MTTIKNLHHLVGSKIGPAHLPWPQECQNQNSFESKVEMKTTHPSSGLQKRPGCENPITQRAIKMFTSMKIYYNINARFCVFLVFK